MSVSIIHRKGPLPIKIANAPNDTPDPDQIELPINILSRIYWLTKSYTLTVDWELVGLQDFGGGPEPVTDLLSDSFRETAPFDLEDTFTESFRLESPKYRVQPGNIKHLAEMDGFVFDPPRFLNFCMFNRGHGFARGAPFVYRRKALDLYFANLTFALATSISGYIIFGPPQYSDQYETGLGFYVIVKGDTFGPFPMCWQIDDGATPVSSTGTVVLEFDDFFGDDPPPP